MKIMKADRTSNELSSDNLLGDSLKDLLIPPLTSLTPLYGIVSDADAITFTNDVDDFPSAVGFIVPVVQLLRAFQLFKPGRFVAGDTSFFVRSQPTGCKTIALARCSEMSIDYQFVEQFTPRYRFDSTEVPFFLTFIERLGSVWQRMDQYPQLDLALHRYCKETAQYGDPIELMISLESLLVPKKKASHSGWHSAWPTYSGRMLQLVKSCLNRSATSMDCGPELSTARDYDRRNSARRDNSMRSERSHEESLCLLSRLLRRWT